MLSIIVCTYNRAEILEECLKAFIDIYDQEYSIELIVVDNNSKDATLKIVDALKVDHDWIIYLQEKNQGLSYARNSGYKEAKYDWVLYLDDDAKVDDHFFSRIYYLTTETDFKCIGGVYLPWYKYGKPKWFRDEFASNKKKYDSITILKKHEHASGGIFLIQKKPLEELGGFNTEFGMKGTEMAYGEEDDLQNRLRDSGIDIAFDPQLIVYHLVPKYKLEVNWLLRSSFNMGKTFLQVNGYPLNIFTGLIALGISIIQTLLLAIISAPQLFSPNYYKENYILDVLRKPAKWYGAFRALWT